MRRPTPPGRMVDVDGVRLHLNCTGSGGPTVVLDAALGGSSVSWSRVQPEIARLTYVCSYDRAGLGWSDPGPAPRTAGRSAAELRRLLDLAGIPPPFVLVGHSFGGLVVRVFAGRFRADTAGIVLVDPAHPEDWANPAAKEQIKIDRGLVLCRVGARAARLRLASLVTALPGMGASGLARAAFAIVSRGRGRGTRSEDAGIVAPVWNLPPDARRALEWFWSQPRFFETLGSQIESICVSARESLDATAGGLGDLPLVTISSTDPGEYRWRQQDSLAALSSRGRHIMASASGHWIPLEQPSVVVDAVTDVLAVVRARTLETNAGVRQHV